MSESSSVASSEGEQGHNNELDAWREVHGLLTNALLVAKEAVGAKKVQRRFWLEEICANLTDGGKLTQNSVWLRPSPPKKTATKRAAKPPTAVPPTKKPRKKKSTDGTPAAAGKTKKLRKRKTNEEDDNDEQSPARPKAKKIRLKLSAKTSATAAPKSNSSVTSSPAAPVDYDHHQQPDNSDTDDDEEDDSDVDAGGSVSHYESGGGSFMRVAEYAQGDTQWGTAGQQVPLMVSLKDFPFIIVREIGCSGVYYCLLPLKSLTLHQTFSIQQFSCLDREWELRKMGVRSRTTCPMGPVVASRISTATLHKAQPPFKLDCMVRGSTRHILPIKVAATKVLPKKSTRSRAAIMVDTSSAKISCTFHRSKCFVRY